MLTKSLSGESETRNRNPIHVGKFGNHMGITLQIRMII